MINLGYTTSLSEVLVNLYSLKDVPANGFALRHPKTGDFKPVVASMRESDVVKIMAHDLSVLTSRIGYELDFSKLNTQQRKMVKGAILAAIAKLNAMHSEMPSIELESKHALLLHVHHLESLLTKVNQQDPSE